jgi:hypothetical protein
MGQSLEGGPAARQGETEARAAPSMQCKSGETDRSMNNLQIGVRRPTQDVKRKNSADRRLKFR